MLAGPGETRQDDDKSSSMSGRIKMSTSLDKFNVTLCNGGKARKENGALLVDNSTIHTVTNTGRRRQGNTSHIVHHTALCLVNMDLHSVKQIRLGLVKERAEKDSRCDAISSLLMIMMTVSFFGLDRQRCLCLFVAEISRPAHLVSTSNSWPEAKTCGSWCSSYL